MLSCIFGNFLAFLKISNSEFAVGECVFLKKKGKRRDFCRRDTLVPPCQALAVVKTAPGSGGQIRQRRDVYVCFVEVGLASCPLINLTELLLIELSRVENYFRSDCVVPCYKQTIGRVCWHKVRIGTIPALWCWSSSAT